MPVSKESKEQLGKALAKAREEAGVTVVEIAQRATPGKAGGLSRYYDAEAGRRMATSETVGHYVVALNRPDLHDLRSKIMNKRPAETWHQQAELPEEFEVAEPQRPRPWFDSAADALPKPELLGDSLMAPLKELMTGQPSLEDGTVVRGREAILGAACVLVEEAIELCADKDRSVAIQVIQLNPERTFTRNLSSSPTAYSRLFPFQIQRLVAAGGGVRQLLSNEIMASLDHWIAFERFIALMELAGDYSVYWLSNGKLPSRAPDYLIIEDVAVLEIFPTGPLTASGDAAVVHRSTSEVVSVIKDFGENLIAEADEAFQVNDPSSSLAVEQARVWVEQGILEAEQTEAPRFLIKYGLSSLTEPLNSYESRTLARYGLSRGDRARWPSWVKQDFELKRRRLANFLRQIENHRSIDLVPRSALTYYAEHGRYSEDCSEFADQPMSIENRIRHLEDVITMIATNPNYELVVIDDEPALTHLAGAGLLMMGRPENHDQPLMIFYESRKPGPDGRDISVAFETSLEIFRQPVGGHIAALEAMAVESATEDTLRLLHDLIEDLQARR